MGSWHFHRIDPEILVNGVPWDVPTQEYYEKFKKPSLGLKKTKHELDLELAGAVQSVLNVARCDVLQYLHYKTEGDDIGQDDGASDRDDGREVTSGWRDFVQAGHFNGIYFADGGGAEGSATHSAPSTSDAGTTEPLSSCEHSTKSATHPGVATPQKSHSKDGEEVLDHFVDYMRHVHKYQHRTFSYTVCVCYDMARLLYFDRSGILVTEPFRWDEKDSLLHRFIWKVAKLANAGRFEDLGHDPTATPASAEARDTFLGLKDDTSLPQHVREGFKMATADDYPVYRLEIEPGEPSADEWFDDMPFPPPKEFGSPSTGQPQSSPLWALSPRSCQDPQLQPLQPGARSFLVGRPHFAAGELVGRCTRGYFAYDVTDADRTNWRVCFLKDSWRPVVPGRTRPEHLVYQRLCFFGADKGIGTLVCGGDVGGHWAQRTRVQDYLPQENRHVLRVHYRLVIEEIGIPLEDFDSFPELSAIFVDVIQAHYRAWTLARVLHADISVSNIMIAPPTGDSGPGRRRGMLIDWDLSRLQCELDPCRTSKPDRLGTWQFRSALSLLYPWKPYARSDDVESFVHAYLFLVCRFHPTDAAAPLSDLVRALFHTRALVADRVAVGGSAKRALFTAGRSTIRVLCNPALQELLDEVVSQCAESYDGIDFDEMRRRYGCPPKLPPSPQSRQGSSESGVSPARRRAVVFDRDDMPRTSSDGSSARARYLQRKADLDLKAARVANSNTDGNEDSDPCVVRGFLSEGGDLVDLFMKHAQAAVQLVRSDKAADQFVARRCEDIYRPGWNDDRDRDRVFIDSESTLGTDPDSSHSILCDASI